MSYDYKQTSLIIDQVRLCRADAAKSTVWFVLSHFFAWVVWLMLIMQVTTVPILLIVMGLIATAQSCILAYFAMESILLYREALEVKNWAS